jgi:hypothetical protein
LCRWIAENWQTLLAYLVIAIVVVALFASLGTGTRCRRSPVPP